MAASTTLMQPASCSSTSSNASVNTLAAANKQLLMSDGDSGTGSDQDHGKTATNNHHSSNMMLNDSSTEEESIDDEQHSTSTSNQQQEENNSTARHSLSSLINLERSLKHHSSSLSSAKNGRQSTGKLERITERLAKKQNANSTNSPSTIDEPLKSSFDNGNAVDHETKTNRSEENRADSSATSEHGGQDEDDDEIKNGFRALGLMGNVAFMGDESFKCPVCGLQLDSQHTFTLHIRSHNPNDHSNTCSLCGKTLSSASSLDRHMLIHSGERPFKCSLCGMAFTTNGNMHRHMRTHGHGSIGYTPRGQKRRAKLLSQALEKAVAAAAAGQHVDFEAINKLKKSILESKVTPSPITTTSTKRSREHKSQKHTTTNDNSSNSLSEQILSTLAPNVSIEAAAAAAVAAAALKTPTNLKQSASSDSSKLLTNTHNQKEKPLVECSPSTVGTRINNTAVITGSTTKQSPITHPSLPLNLTNNPHHALLQAAAAGCWPSPDHLNQLISAGTNMESRPPEKGRPGRKKKPKLDTSNGPSNDSAGPNSTNNIPSLVTSGMAGCRCPICGHSVANTASLHLHMMTFHLEERLFCNDCGMILDNYDTYTQHHCTASAATVMNALSQNPNLHSDLLFCSSNTSRMNFSSARPYTANLEMLRGLSSGAQHLLTAAQLSQMAAAAAASTLAATTTASSTASAVQPNKTNQPSLNCKECKRKFQTNKELKDHLASYCHQCNLECDSPSTYQLHQFSHSFHKLTNNHSDETDENKYNNHKNRSPTASHPPSSMASLANMKSDLADIESILSIVHGASAAAAATTNGKPDKPVSQPISPNRASHASAMPARLQAVNGGEATNQPDSPASADSAAGPAACTGLSQQQSAGELGESSKTDLNRTSDNNSDDNDPKPVELSWNGKHESSGERFRCEPCRLSFKSMNALRRHNRGHTAGGGHSHACHLCSYKSLDKSTLIRHLRTHNGERPFQCAICKYAFTTKANCERHVRKRHRNLKSKSEIRSAMQYNRDMAATAAATKLVSEKIFIERDQLPTSQDTVCKKCNMDFGSNRELRAHLRVPNNACSEQLKPFLCTICNIGFNTRNNCVRHIIKQHPSTIELSEEDAAKVESAAHSLIMESGGSSCSLSPSSNGRASSHSGSFSGSLSPASSEIYSECESYDTYDELENQSSLIRPQSKQPPNQSSLDALCQVVNNSTSTPSSTGPLNLSGKNNNNKNSHEHIVDKQLHTNAQHQQLTAPFILDLSFKTK